MCHLGDQLTKLSELPAAQLAGEVLGQMEVRLGAR
jgi:hypothetical protein